MGLVTLLFMFGGVFCGFLFLVALFVSWENKKSFEQVGPYELDDIDAEDLIEEMLKPGYDKELTPKVVASSKDIPSFVTPELMKYSFNLWDMKNSLLVMAISLIPLYILVFIVRLSDKFPMFKILLLLVTGVPTVLVIIPRLLSLRFMPKHGDVRESLFISIVTSTLFIILIVYPQLLFYSTQFLPDASNFSNIYDRLLFIIAMLVFSSVFCALGISVFVTIIWFLEWIKYKQQYVVTWFDNKNQ